MTRILPALAASAIALALAVGTPSVAQEGVEELRASVSTALAEMGIAVEGGPETLSDDQVLEISSVLDSSDNDTAKEEQIKLILSQ